MGRQLRRVPLDFSHPTRVIWPGYVNPYRIFCTNCGACEGSGSSPDARRFNREWYGSIYPDAHFDPRSTGSEPFLPTHPAIYGLARRNTENNGRLSQFIYDSSPLYANRRPSICGAVDPALCNEHPSLCSDCRRSLTARHIMLIEHGDYFQIRATDREALRLAAHFNASWSHHLSDADVSALLAADHLWDFTRRPLSVSQALDTHSNGWTRESNGYTPSAAEIKEWSLSGFGHDSINAGICIRARCEREGIDPACPDCHGSGEVWGSPEAEAASEAWEPTDPPSGDGYQMWETVSEGSPISPVFSTAETLAAYLGADPDNDSDAATWLRMISRGGWAMSGVVTPETGYVDGVAFVGRELGDTDDIDAANDID